MMEIPRVRGRRKRKFIVKPDIFPRFMPEAIGWLYFAGADQRVGGLSPYLVLVMGFHGKNLPTSFLI